MEPAIGFSQYTPAYHDFLFNEWMHADAGFKGLIDDVRLYEHPLDEDEVNNLYDYSRP